MLRRRRFALAGDAHSRVWLSWVFVAQPIAGTISSAPPWPMLRPIRRFGITMSSPVRRPNQRLQEGRGRATLDKYAHAQPDRVSLCDEGEVAGPKIRCVWWCWWCWWCGKFTDRHGRAVRNTADYSAGARRLVVARRRPGAGGEELFEDVKAWNSRCLPDFRWHRWNPWHGVAVAAW